MLNEIGRISRMKKIPLLFVYILLLLVCISFGVCISYEFYTFVDCAFAGCSLNNHFFDVYFLVSMSFLFVILSIFFYLYERKKIELLSIALRDIGDNVEKIKKEHKE